MLPPCHSVVKGFGFGFGFDFNLNFLQCFKHCNHIFKWDISLDIMHSIEHKPAIFIQYPDLSFNLFLNLLRSAECKDPLRIHSPSPENYPLPESFL